MEVVKVLKEAATVVRLILEGMKHPVLKNY